MQELAAALLPAVARLHPVLARPPPPPRPLVITVAAGRESSHREVAASRVHGRHHGPAPGPAPVEIIVGAEVVAHLPVLRGVAAPPEASRVPLARASAVRRPAPSPAAGRP